MIRRPSTATVTASVALFFSLAGTGLAASHYLITSVSQIKPSVRHALRGAVGPAGTTGEQGVPGVPGAAGTQGPTGMTGPAGQPWSGMMVRTSSLQNLPSDDSAAAFTLDCPSGKFAVTGGYETSGGTTILSSRPSLQAAAGNKADLSGADLTGAPTGWVVSASGAGGTVTVWVVCGQG